MTADKRVSLWRDPFGRTATRSAQLIIIVALVALAVSLLVVLRLVVVPFVVATMLTAAMWPVVLWLRNKGFGRTLSAWITLGTALTVLGGLGYLIYRGVAREWDDLITSGTEGLQELRRLVLSALPISAEQLDGATTAAFSALSGQQARAQAITGATAVFEVIAGVFLLVIILFFLLKDGPKIWNFFLHRWKPSSHERAQRIGDRSLAMLGRYVRGTAVIALVDAVFIGVALVVLGVPLALPLSVVVFLGAFIPLAGATAAGALAAMIALVTNGPVTALIVVGIVVAINQIEGDVLAPIVLGRAVSLHPLVILVGLTAGTIVAGIIGALLAVPLVALAWTVISAWHEPDETKALETLV